MSGVSHCWFSGRGAIVGGLVQGLERLVDDAENTDSVSMGCFSGWKTDLIQQREDREVDRPW